MVHEDARRVLPATHRNPSTRAPKRRASRATPKFYFFHKPELFLPVTNKFGVGGHPIWDDPRFVVQARVRIQNINAESFEPPDFNANAYFPQTYVTNIARRLADWCEYQGFFSGKGSEANGTEGCIFVQALGEQSDTGNLGLDLGETAWESDIGNGQGIPLEQHPRDRVIEASPASNRHAYASMYHKNGTELVKEYCEQLWPAVQKEFTRRGLAMPARFHFDYESSPQGGTMMAASNLGTWEFHEDDNGIAMGGNSDARWDDETNHAVYTDALSGDMSVEDVAADLDPGDWDPTKPFGHADNEGFRDWFFGWRGHVRLHAFVPAVKEPSQTEFPDALWSNFDDFVADDPNYKFAGLNSDKIFNTKRAGLETDFAAPVFYPPNDFTSYRSIDSGVTWGQTTRSITHKVWTSGVDACVNTSEPMPLSPWFSGVGYQRFEGNPSVLVYEQNFEDTVRGLTYAWMRGSDEFILWAFADATDDFDFAPGSGELEVDDSAATDFHATYLACRWVADSIEGILEARRASNSRTGRTGRTVR